MEFDTSGKLRKLLQEPMTEKVIESIQQTVRSLHGPEMAMTYALDYFSKITKDVQDLSAKSCIDFGELVDGLHQIIEIIKGVDCSPVSNVAEKPRNLEMRDIPYGRLAQVTLG